MRCDLDLLISQRAGELRAGKLNPAAVLHALAAVESNHGERSLASLHEPAYCYSGRYHNEELQRLSKPYGCLAHSSYSSWQILFIAAYEEGFRGDPCELRNDAVAIRVVTKYLNRRIFDRYPGIEIRGVGDAWNSGNPRDRNEPEGYMDKLEAAYTDWQKRLTP